MPKCFAYVAGALSGLDPDKRTRPLGMYDATADVVREFDLEAYLLHKVSDPVDAASMLPREVDTLDRRAVTSAVLVIAYVGTPATGVGAEIEMANHANKPVFLVCEEKKVIRRELSRLVRGNPAVSDLICFDEDDLEDLLNKLRVYLRSFCVTLRDLEIPELLRV